MQAEFSPEVTALLAQAGSSCERRGVRLTGLRRQVLGLVLAAPRPQGAYELLDGLRAVHGRAAPPTVYRALDFLLEQGLVHKLEKLSAFVGCVHGITHPGHGHAEAGHAKAGHTQAGHTQAGHADGGHAAQFLICRGCGTVAELDDPEIGRALARAAGRDGFTVLGATVEVDGLCDLCRTAA